MDFDDLLIRFFGTPDIDTLDQERLLAGVNRLRVQFGLERDGERRFALWCLLHLLGLAPDPEEAFQDEADRAAAREFIADTESEDEADD